MRPSESSRSDRSDCELLLASGHDPDAFRQLYDRYAGAIHAFFHRRTLNREAALDLTAETFAGAWTSRHTFVDSSGGTAGPWLFGIARNVLSRSARERRLAEEARDALRLVRPSSSIVPDSTWLEGMEADLEDAIAALPDGQRRAVELRVISDQSYDVIARDLNCSPVAARIRVSRGLSRLRADLNDHPMNTRKET